MRRSWVPATYAAGTALRQRPERAARRPRPGPGPPARGGRRFRTASNKRREDRVGVPAACARGTTPKTSSRGGRDSVTSFRRSRANRWLATLESCLLPLRRDPRKLVDHRLVDPQPFDALPGKANAKRTAATDLAFDVELGLVAHQ